MLVAVLNMCSSRARKPPFFGSKLSSTPAGLRTFYKSALTNRCEERRRSYSRIPSLIQEGFGDRDRAPQQPSERDMPLPMMSMGPRAGGLQVFLRTNALSISIRFSFVPRTRDIYIRCRRVPLAEVYIAQYLRTSPSCGPTRTEN